MPTTTMNDTYAALIERKEYLEQQLYLVDSISERVAVDNELTQVENALADAEEVN